MTRTAFCLLLSLSQLTNFPAAFAVHRTVAAIDGFDEGQGCNGRVFSSCAWRLPCRRSGRVGERYKGQFLRQKWDRSIHSINGYGLSLSMLALDTVREG